MHISVKAVLPISVTKREAEFNEKVGPELLSIKINIQVQAKKPFFSY